MTIQQAKYRPKEINYSLDTQVTYKLATLEKDFTINADTQHAKIQGNSLDNLIKAYDSTSAGASIDGGAGNDTLLGGDWSDSLLGGAGNDSIDAGSAGQDAVDGGSGDDTIVTHSAATVVGGAGNDLLTAKGGTLNGYGGAGNDTLTSVAGNDELFGEGGNDVLSSGAGDDLLDGGSGNDKLNGGDGSDVLIGGAGADTLTGGAGADVFVYTYDDDSTLKNFDVITDFNPADDKLNLNMVVDHIVDYKAKSGALKATILNQDEVGFDKTTGMLYVNTDEDDTIEFAIKLTGVTELTPDAFYSTNGQGG